MRNEVGKMNEIIIGIIGLMLIIYLFFAVFKPEKF